MKYNIIDSKDYKILNSENLHMIFNKQNGVTATWGKTRKEDPNWSPFGPFILDIEVSTICHGTDKEGPCKWCYKSNTSKGKNMSVDTFKRILDKMPKTLVQCALGIGDVDSNPELFAMMEYSRSIDIVPNLTINGFRLNDFIIDRLAKLAGVVCVSCYDLEVCLRAVKALKGAGLAQVNIHYLLSKERSSGALKMLQEAKKIEGLNSLVFMTLKGCGTRNNLNMIDSIDIYKDILRSSIELKVPVGFDSCAAPAVLRAMKEIGLDGQESVEPCEGTCFSSYIDVEGKFFPCSFSAESGEWKGTDVLSCNDFLKDVWFGEEATRFRKMLLEGDRKCPIFHLLY